MTFNILTLSIILMITGAFEKFTGHNISNSETGQSQFAAIAEIITILRNDSDTDWKRVDINSLRNHLVDMDNVTTKAKVESVINDLSVSFTVSGDGVIAKSIQRMVMAHSPMLQQATGWSVTAEKRFDGANMQIQLDSIEELNVVAGLGFFGLLTIGAHHQQHHLMIAKGHSPH